MGKRKKGKATKKTKQSQAQNAEEHYKKAPHSFVINRGHVGKNVSELITDMRRVMSPYTASKLKTRRKNVLKDFVTIAGTLNVSHLLMFTKSETSTNLRVTRLPRGPTLTFQVQKFSLCKDVVSSLKRHNMDPKQFNLHPLLVMNNFTGEGVHLKLMSSMFQNLFPSINVTKVKLNDIRRCVLFNYNQEDETIEFRHYNIKVVPVGMGRAVKKLIKAKIPNMSRFDDVSEFVLG
ncbi:suppressor of SWI4 1 homolog [Lingula anatina]|nr:suppressor of SWI4 1 homolog [Lingula anatina]|eukprot:XP_013405109.1 suppressor of SWI4 1 homolog [Lingula anatina]